MRMRNGAGILSAAAFALSACQAGTPGPTAGGSALAAGYPFCTHRDCDAEVALELQNAGIAPPVVDTIWYEDKRRLDSGNDDRVVGYLAHARLKEQPGLAVVEVNRFCQVVQVYTRDGLSLPGIPAF